MDLFLGMLPFVVKEMGPQMVSSITKLINLVNLVLDM